MPIAIGAKKVFVAAPKTLQYPKAATNKGFNPKTGAIITPRLDPIANKTPMEKMVVTYGLATFMEANAVSPS